MIQYISAFEKVEKMRVENIVSSSISTPRSLDEFKINVIDLNVAGIWENRGSSNRTINSIADLENLRLMIDNSSSCKVLIIFPQSHAFRWDYKNLSYRQYTTIKNNLENVSDIIKIISETYLEIVYENTTTRIEDFAIDSNFYFRHDLGGFSVKSDKSKKITVTKLTNTRAVTTLDIQDYNQLMSLLRQVQFIDEKSTVPEWVIQMDWFNDNELKQEIASCEEGIELLTIKKSEAEEAIDKNNNFKSILYTNGDELVDVVFEILEQILNFKPSQFEDKKKEDFLVKYEDRTFIGEVKGITSNVKSAHVSQLEVHYQGYLDKLSESGIAENVKAILIINHQRSKPLTEREAVHKIQIDLAERYNSLIIETTTLLTIYEKFLSKELDQAEIKDMFTERKGLLKV